MTIQSPDTSLQQNVMVGSRSSTNVLQYVGSNLIPVQTIQKNVINTGNTAQKRIPNTHLFINNAVNNTEVSTSCISAAKTVNQNPALVTITNQNPALVTITNQKGSNVTSSLRISNECGVINENGIGISTAHTPPPPQEDCNEWMYVIV